MDLSSLSDIYDVIVTVADYISTLMDDIDYSSILDIISNIISIISDLI